MMAAMSQNNQGIKLNNLLADYVSINCLPDILITGIQLDSRKIRSGNIFVALAGENTHALSYAQDAIANGAVAILCDRKFDQDCQQMLTRLLTQVICVPINDLEAQLGEIASRFYGHPSSDMFVVGVTGTDGKTSVSNFIAQALDDVNDRCAIIGTIGNGLLGELTESTHTTPDVLRVHELLSEYKSRSVTQAAMEVSSHGLDQGRVDAVKFNVAVLTNLGRDHLDYHGDLESYRNAKKKLFSIEGLSAAVINLDDEFGCQLAKDLQNKLDVWGYSVESSNQDIDLNNILRVTDIKTTSHGLKIHIESSYGSAEIQSDLLGEFNVSNILATLAVLLIKGISFDDAIQRLHRLKTVPGRVETVRLEGKPLVVIDYAHTPQALASVLKTLRAICTARLYCVFGCGGDRDKGKRPLMAQAAEQYADNIILTDDNPRTENSEDIIEQIRSGFADLSNVLVIQDRASAISHAINSAGSDDVILIAGKGHENYQLIGNERFPFSDIQAARNSMGGAE
ncbi:MAG: UDP-N-acetylmuramoyl-L-alanyl-D-glutamate--2,6-diaminopimelate ligase [Gammaproteobacteria bacterium]|nr:UDP-N-acetylmuramoyl-L-alanyl-D-glutamate--2,6-diaminopimelate ligase [Gammaproteobacteria bacterium]